MKDVHEQKFLMLLLVVVSELDQLCNRMDRARVEQLRNGVVDMYSVR